MLQRLARRARELMKHPTKQAADFNPDSLNAIRAHLRLSGISAKEATFAMIARLALRSWVDALDAKEKVDVRQVRADIEERYSTATVIAKQIGVSAGELVELPDAIYAHLNTHELLQPYLTNNRHKTPNRRLIIYLAVERYARAVAPHHAP